MNITYLLSEVRNSVRKRKDCKQQIINESPTQSRAGDVSVSMVDVVHTPEVV